MDFVIGKVTFGLIYTQTVKDVACCWEGGVVGDVGCCCGRCCCGNVLLDVRYVMEGVCCGEVCLSVECVMVQCKVCCT